MNILKRPNDDDAVLFFYKLFIEKYGWEWLTGFLSNRPLLVRGTEEPFNLVANGSQYWATFSTAGSLKPKPNDTIKFILPRNDPFVSWGQRAAIFKQSKRKNAAKLYMSWWLDPQTQTDVWQSWSVRKDIPVPTGFRSIFNYSGQTDPVAFERFVEDRVGVEEFKGKIRIFVGEPVGSSPPGELGSHPDKMDNCLG
jgi:ABC-type Fe3+ transport system substrate-binding protein